MNDKQDTTPLTYIGNDNAKAFIQKKANIQRLLECVVFLLLLKFYCVDSDFAIE